MGGWGSGRKGGFDTTDGYKRLDIRKLQRESVLNRRHSFSWEWYRNDEMIGNINIRPEDARIVLSYTCRRGGYGEWTPLEYGVEIERTACHFGGWRVWFRCPAIGCYRRVAVLYGAEYFVCRKCYRLAYPCQREKRSDRATRRAYVLREKACKWGSLFEPLFRKKGMHQTTFKRIEEKYYQQVRVAFSDYPGEVDWLEEYIGDPELQKIVLR